MASKYVFMDPTYRLYFHQLLRHADKYLRYDDDTDRFWRKYSGSIFLSEASYEKLLESAESHYSSMMSDSGLSLEIAEWSANNFHGRIRVKLASYMVGPVVTHELVSIESGYFTYVFHTSGGIGLWILHGSEIVANG